MKILLTSLISQECLHEISFSISGIRNLLNLDTNKSPGPDSIPAVLLKKCADEISPILQVTQSMIFRTLPDDWLFANITPVYKKNDRANSNYRPISLTAVCCKTMEHIIHIFSHGTFQNLSCSLRLFTDNCLLYQVILSEEDYIKLQHNLDSIYKCSDALQMRYNLDKSVTLKCQLLAYIQCPASSVSRPASGPKPLYLRMLN